MNKNQLIITKKLIRKCYNINSSIPKGYGTYSSDYAKWYKMKNKLILKILEKIKKYQLPIKYGGSTHIIYFCFDGAQFSFHGDFSVMKLKKYAGKWQGTRRTKKQVNKNKNIIGKRDLFYTL